jgi:uncharacterized LabA/DUF88 family protein
MLTRFSHLRKKNMPDRTYVYVDGESHFIRSECAWRKLHGEHARLEQLRHKGQKDGKLILVDASAKIFWTRKMNPGVHRAYCFTSIVGDEPALHAIRVSLRDFGFDPMVERERKQLACQRQNALLNQHLIEKPKGVDIALAVQMLEDSLRAFDVCHLYTSDVDFVPVIKAVRSRGKQVFVHGYKDGLSDSSPMFHVCDLFSDLEELLRDQCELDRSTDDR